MLLVITSDLTDSVKKVCQKLNGMGEICSFCHILTSISSHNTIDVFPLICFYC